MKVDANKLKTELEKAGVYITDIYDLVNSTKSYPAAIPVLLDLIKEEFIDIKLKEGVVRALAVKESVGKVSPILIAEYNKTPTALSLYRWAIGNTIYTTITEKDIDSILQIVQDTRNGISRQMFVLALGKTKSKKAEDVLINLLDDDEVASQSLDALGRIKSKKAKTKIELLTNHPSQLIRREARKTLGKII